MDFQSLSWATWATECWYASSIAYAEVERQSAPHRPAKAQAKSGGTEVLSNLRLVLPGISDLKKIVCRAVGIEFASHHF